MKQYKVLKEMINAPVGTRLSIDKDPNLSNDLSFIIIDNIRIQDAINQCFIKEYIPEPKHWRAEQGGTFWVVVNCNVIEMSDDYCYVDNNYYNTGNYYRAKETAELVVKAWSLGFIYLHTIPGTPQQNIKNEFEKAHAKARKAVLKDDGNE